MNVLPVSTIQNQRNMQFKGTVDKSIDKFINDCIRHYCIDYKQSLTTTQAIDIAKLEEIKGSWYVALEILKAKAKSLHKDTVLYIDFSENNSMNISVPGRSAHIRAKNEKICSDVPIKLVYALLSSKARAAYILLDAFSRCVKSLGNIDMSLLHNAESSHTVSNKVLCDFRKEIEIATKKPNNYTEANNTTLNKFFKENNL